MSELFIETWGDGTRVVLVHGSLAVGNDEWQAQRPLGEQGFQLVVIDRRGYGRSAAAAGEDFLRDADDIAESSWFPLVDRNPQVFMEIPTAKPSDFKRRHGASTGLEPSDRPLRSWCSH